MSGIEIKLSGRAKPNGGLDVSFDVASAAVHIPEVPLTRLALAPDAPEIDALGQMVSDPDLDTPIVTAAGAVLLDAIKAHQNAQYLLTTALNAPVTSDIREIMVHVPSYANKMRQLPWEVLYDTQTGFLDHDSKLPVVRMIKPTPTATQPTAALPVEGLSIVSVIAAQDIDGLPEYKALRRALEAYDRPWSLTVYSPNHSVQQAITQEGAAHIKHAHVPTTSAQLKREIETLKPQVCHFFCHGVSVGDSAASLELETLLSASGDKTLQVTPGDLCAALPSSAWLVLLNACSSGETPSNSSSLAAQLVENGVPVVIGMREPTTSATLRAFTQSFLADALVEISKTVDKNAPSELRFGPALSAARASICTAYRRDTGEPAKRIKDWSLPVMMVSTRKFEIEPGTQGNELLIAELRARLGTLTDFRDRLATNLSFAEAQAIDAEIGRTKAQINGLIT